MTRKNIAWQLLLRALEWLGTGLVILIVTERFNQGGTEAFKSWLFRYPTLAFYNLLIIILCYGLIRLFLTKPVLPAFIFSGTLFFAGTSHYLKLLLKGEPLLPMDIYNIKVAAQIAPNMNIQLGRGFWLNLGFVLLWLVVLYFYEKKLWQPLPWRRVYIFVPAVLVIGLALNSFGDIGRRNQLGITDIRYNQIQNYKQNGFVLASITNAGSARVKKPAAYQEAFFYNLLSELNERNEAKQITAVQQTNIIVLQMEAYSDPRLWDTEIKLEPDPFFPLDKYRSNMHSLKVLTSVLGGSTATTEFEVLTGYNTAHTAQGIIPFVQYMNKEKPSLVWDLKKLGYDTVGIHPNMGTFYNRNVAYPNLGFENFIDIKGFINPKYIGYYVADESLLEVLKETLNGRDKSRPLFCFAVSIQNHGPYNLPGINREYNVEEGSIPLNEDQIQELRNFSANILDSSLMLADLLEYLQDLDEPYLVLVYGDHHANWSWGSQLSSGLDQISRKYLTEGFFWANYPIEFETRPVISANYLSPYILKYADISLPAYYQVLYKFSQEIAGYNPFFIINNDGSLRNYNEKDMEANAIVQYDRLFGKQYLDKLAGADFATESVETK